MLLYNIDGEEYEDYIQKLQQQQLLNDDLEYLELEELQGVTGLKALRVGVKLD
jgi:oligoribonuclease NrnB/cAMP/cGMP phosphodiesterase (DHH superfamily)